MGPGVVKLGREAGVATPANDEVCATLAVHAAGRAEGAIHDIGKIAGGAKCDPVHKRA